ncbi:MAG: type II secretion system protein, partial [Rickettsiales bacterium]
KSITGFSLVELSIVLVILGLLVGGILSGQALIRAAELRSVVTEHQKYFTAVQTYRDKYFALPGDNTNATMLWGKDNAACAAHTGTAATAGTCNGDGDGRIEPAAAASSTGEIQQFWKQLALAGLIEGTFPGISDSGSAGHCNVGSACPRARIANAGWAVEWRGNYAGDSYAYTADYGNYLVMGTQNAVYLPNNSVLRPTEAWNIDKKVDDGKPGTGTMIALEGAAWGGAATSKCTTSTSQSDYAGEYNLSGSGVICALMFLRQF